MPGSARPCWTGSPIAPTFSRPARNPIDSGGRPKNAIGRRKRRKATKVSCGNDGPWKAWKTQKRFPTLPTALGNPASAAVFPHSHSYGGGPYSYGKAKQKPHPTYNIPRWAKLNRRNGPKEVAKRTARSKTPCTCGNTSRGNREIPCPPGAASASGRVGKSKDTRR